MSGIRSRKWNSSCEPTSYNDWSREQEGGPPLSASTAKTLDELKLLPTAEKLEAIGDLWDSIPPEEAVADSATLDELDRRYAEIDRNPARLLPWDQFLSTLRNM